MRRYQRMLLTIGGAMPQKIKTFFFTLAGMKIGQHTVIKTGFYSDMPERVTIGNKSFLNCFVRIFFGINSDAYVTVGNNVYFGPNVSLLCVTHEIGDEGKRAGKTIHKPIEIEDGVWVGANVTIFPGVKIAHGGVIGANSVVDKSTEPNALYYGIPVKKIRDM